ncbi:MAG: high-affinity branched-chain amino acid ABC transporter permease LivM [Alphaproteobacteria bacterium]
MSAAAHPLDMRSMLKEAALTAFVVLMLTIVLVGFELRDVPGAIALYTRFPDVFACAVLAFLGRIAIVLLREGYRGAVIIGAGVACVLLLVGLLPEVLFGTETAVQLLRRIMPFEAPVVQWCLFGLAFYLLLRAALGRRQARTVSVKEREVAADAMGARVQSIARYAGPFLGLLAVALPVAFRNDQQVMSVAILVMTYIMLGWGLNIVVGLAGLLDLGYVAFYAVGAYTFALLATTEGIELSFWLCLPLAGILAGLIGVLLGFPVLRLRGDYLAIVTLGFGEIIRVVIQNWYGFTNGANGIGSIPRPTLFGLSWEEEAPEGQVAFWQWFSKNLWEVQYSATHEKIFLFYIILALALVVNWFALRARRMPIGRAWEALREDEVACRSLGINPTNTKLTAFGVGAMFGGFAGAFFATSQGFVSPESFVFIESAIILAIVVLGGFGSQLGVVLAALLLIGLPEAFREVKDFRMLAFGLAMVGIMLWRPAGLLAHREPTVRLHAGGKGKKKP